MAKIYQNITELIGNTPLLELSGLARSNNTTARILGKVEAFNPASSVKDRIAWAIIDQAEREGKLKPGDLIVDITSGNTGIALAAIATARGYRAKFYLGDNTSEEKSRIIKTFGAEVVTVSNELFLDPEGVAKLFDRAVAENPDAFIADQLANPANPKIHYQSTGPEIWQDTAGTVDAFVAGVGTGGTISGVGKYLKEQNPSIHLVVVEPGPNSIPTETNIYPKEIDGVHPVKDIPADNLPKNYDTSIADEVIPVEGVEAYSTARQVARTDGILVGSSAGAILTGALTLAARPEFAQKTIVAILPDTGERYLSVWAD